MTDDDLFTVDHTAVMPVNGNGVQFETWWDGQELTDIVALGAHLADHTMATAARGYIEGPVADAHTTGPVYGDLLAPAEEMWDGRHTVARAYGGWQSGGDVQRWEESTSPRSGLAPFTRMEFER